MELPDGETALPEKSSPQNHDDNSQETTQQSSQDSPSTSPIKDAVERTPAAPKSSMSLEDKCDNPACKELAVLVCGICNDAPSLAHDPPIAQYCSMACQKTDLRRHVDHCDKVLDRMTLFRAMEVAERQLQAFRELSWHAFDINAVERRMGDDGKDYVVAKGVTVDNPCWPDDYRPFPSRLIKHNEDRAALLVFLAKYDAVSLASEWIHGLLGGVVVEILKVVHEVKHAPRKMVLEEISAQAQCSVLSVDGSVTAEVDHATKSRFIWEELNNEALKVKLRSGEEYAIDLAGAQYGHWKQPVIEWGEYKHARTATLTTIAPPEKQGSLNPIDYRLSARVRAWYAMSIDETEKDLLIRHLEAVNIYLMEWQLDGKMSLKELWQAQSKVYRQKMENLCDFVEYKLNRFPKINGTVRGREMSRLMRLTGKWDFSGAE